MWSKLPSDFGFCGPNFKEFEISGVKKKLPRFRFLLESTFCRWGRLLSVASRENGLIGIGALFDSRRCSSLRLVGRRDTRPL